MEEETIHLTEILLNAINELFSQLFSSIDNTIYSILDDITFIQPDILSNPTFRHILGESNAEGILLICNSLILGFILYYAINYLLSHLTYAKIDSPKQFIFKAIIFIAIMNASIWICEQIIHLISLITISISNISENTFHEEACFSNFINHLNQSLYIGTDSFNLFSFDGIIKSFTSFGLINLVFTYSLRYIMIQIFILLSPFAFLSLISNSSEWFFKVWIKSFLSLLLVQILISLILLLSFSINPTPNTTLSKLLFIGIIYALTRANNFMKELFGGISTTVTASFSQLSNMH